MRSTVQHPKGQVGLAPDVPSDAQAARTKPRGSASPQPGGRPAAAGRAARARRPATSNRQPAIAGAVAAIWALSVGLILLSVVVMLLWVLAPNSEGGAADAWRGVGMVWLAAHQVPLVIGGRDLTLLPIGAVIPALLLLRRAGAWAARLVPRPSPLECFQVVLGGATTYGAGAAGVAWLTAGTDTFADPARAGLVGAAVGTVGLTWGLGRAVGLVSWVRQRTPETAWLIGQGSLVATTGLFAMGSAMLTTSLILQFHDMRATIHALAPGMVGSLGVFLVCAAALPTMAIWWMSILLGPGVSFGAAGSLSAFGGELGRLPALPVLASLPAEIPGAAGWLLLIPVAMGVLAGQIRWRRDLPTGAGVALGALGVAGGTALLVGGLQRLALGSLGGDRMDQVGPLLLPSIAAAAGLVMLGFLIDSGILTLRLLWELHWTASLDDAATERAGRPADAPAAGPVLASVQVGRRLPARPGAAGRTPSRRAAPERAADRVSPRVTRVVSLSPGAVSGAGAPDPRPAADAGAGSGAAPAVAGGTAGRERNLDAASLAETGPADFDTAPAVGQDPAAGPAPAHSPGPADGPTSAPDADPARNGGAPSGGGVQSGGPVAGERSDELGDSAEPAPGGPGPDPAPGGETA